MTGDLETLGTRPRGRPTLYDGCFCARVLELAGKGFSKAEIAADLGVSQRMLDSWGTAHPEFREAMRRAKDLEYAWWLRTGREGLTDKNWNLASWELQMKNRFGRRFAGRGAQKQAAPEPKESINAGRIREDMERKLSRIADAGAPEGVPCEPLGPAGGEAGV
jgi:hypothetical protein